MAAKSTAKSAPKTKKKESATQEVPKIRPKSFTPTPESLAALAAGKEYGIRTSEFTNRALVFYAEHFGYLKNKASSVEERLEFLERYVFKEKFDEARTVLSDEELKTAQEILAEATSIPMNSKQSRPLNDELGKNLHWSVWYALHLAPFHNGKLKHISTDSAEDKK